MHASKGIQQDTFGTAVDPLLMLQVSSKLYQLEQLGPEFEKLATNYRDLQEDLEHAHFTLAEFRKAAADT